METCKLCQKRTADKTNTHYLTDAIIRSCLNEDGSNARQKAMAFNISLDEKSIEARFQRSTSQKGILKNFGREATEDEIEAAKRPLFAVDYVFCSECEKKFTSIETPFLQEILPVLRGKDFTGEVAISINHPSVRPFFLLQVYRTGVCEPTYNLTKGKTEKLRQYFDTPDADIHEIDSIPLHITYLNTLGGDKEFTTNTVGLGTQNNNRTIFCNDFIIQTSSDDTAIDTLNYHGLNEKDSLKDFSNQNEETFRIRIFDNEKRKALFGKYHLEKAERFKTNYRKDFSMRYFMTYGVPAPPTHTEEFVNAVIYSEDINDESKYSAAHFEKMCAMYLDKFRP